MYILSKRVLTLLQIRRILQRWIAQVTSVWRKGWGRVEERFSAHVNAKRARSSCSCAHGIPASNGCPAGWYYNISPLSKLEVLDKESPPCRSGKTACQRGKQSTEIRMVGSCGWFLQTQEIGIMLKKDAFNFPKKILKLIWNGVLGYNSDRKVRSRFLDFKIMIRGLLWELQLCSDFSSVKKNTCGWLLGFGN